MLCNACRNVLDRIQRCSVDLNRQIRHHDSVKGLYKSIEQGCALCNRIDFQSIVSENEEGWRTYVNTAWDDSYQIFKDAGPGDERERILLLFFQCEQAGGNAGNIGISPIGGNFRLIPTTLGRGMYMQPA